MGGSSHSSTIIYGMKIDVELDATKEEIMIIEKYLRSMPASVIVNGLSFTYKRWKKEQEGLLRIGRKSKVKREVSMLTKEQAIWRLENWDIMVREYRAKGYSYPTISRIKKALMIIKNEDIL